MSVPVFKSLKNLELGGEIAVKIKLYTRIYTIMKKDKKGRRPLHFIGIPKKLADAYRLKDDDVLVLDVIAIYVNNKKVRGAKVEINSDPGIPVFISFKDLELGERIPLKARIFARVTMATRRMDNKRVFFAYIPKRFVDAYGLKDDDVIEAMITTIYTQNRKIKKLPPPPIVKRFKKQDS